MSDDSGEDAQPSTSEGCSTPRYNNPVSAHAPQGSVTISPAESEESEADIIERNIRMANVKTILLAAEKYHSSGGEAELQKLSSEIEPTTLLSAPIMHTVESITNVSSVPIQSMCYGSPPQYPSQPHPPAPQTYFGTASYFSSHEQQFIPMYANEKHFPNCPTSTPNIVPPEHQQVQPSAPPIHQMEPASTIPLVDVTKLPHLTPLPYGPKPSLHLGKRAYGACPPLVPQTPNTTNVSSPQEDMNISLSPITSPNTTFLLTPSIHWYFSNPDGSWTPFSYCDSTRIEDAFNALVAEPGSETSVNTDGGRYNVSLTARQRIPVYWDGIASAIRRCSWFYRGNHDIMQPYNEDKANLLEEHYCTAVKLKTFPMRVELGNGEAVIINSHTMMVQYTRTDDPEQSAPRLVRRGVPEQDKIPPDEKVDIDHLVFVVHGIGSVANIKSKSFVDCVSDMRVICQKLLREHWDKINNKVDIVGRVEFLPIQWHAALHTDTLGVDRHIHKLTLNSIPLLRDFVNSTCVDVLFYTSPYYCEAIIQQCGSEMNRLYKLFSERNPGFNGRVSIAGHSLGAVIAFDILSQQSEKHPEITALLKEVTMSSSCSIVKTRSSDSVDLSHGETPVHHIPQPPVSRDRASSIIPRTATYFKSKITSSNMTGTGQPLVSDVALMFQPHHLFSMGSPLGLFLTVRGVHALDPTFSLPTCKRFYNIFHPYDPVAYKLEPLVTRKCTEPVTLPHHKGRKRMHKEITEQLARVGVAMKNQISNTLMAFYSSSSAEESGDTENEGTTKLQLVQYGSLNAGQRIDYMLQESPLEIVNEYLFSLSSHLCYWSSEDTMLLIVREIFKTDESIPVHLPLV